MMNINKLDNHEIILYHEIINKQIDNIKKDIIKDISNLLGKQPEIKKTTQKTNEKFKQRYKRFSKYIKKEKEEMFLSLLQEKENIKKEIDQRQRLMLKEIGIQEPSMRVKMIMKETNGSNFQSFHNMITYLKQVKQGKGNKRTKPLYGLKNLIKYFENLGTTIIEVLSNNQGPMVN